MDVAALDRFNDYLHRGHHQVLGWLQESALLMALVAHRRQRALGLGGAVCEIGVHHGRFFLGLGLLCGGTERAVAIDVFDDQHLNPDGSGKGDRAIFEDNLARWGIASRTTILQGDSRAVRPGELREAFGGGGVRLFSVDGAHAKDYALADTQLATAVLATGGVVMLDDFMNPDWPGVTEAALEMLASADSDLAPIAISGGKLFLVRATEHTDWLDFLVREVWPFAVIGKRVELSGWNCLVLELRAAGGLPNVLGQPLLGHIDLMTRPDIGASGALRAGWSTTEAWGCWGQGPVSKLSLSLRGGASARTVMLFLSSFFHEARNIQTLEVMTGGQRLGEVKIAAAGFQWYALPLPAGCTDGARLSLDIRASEFRSPAQLGMSSDTRPLSFGLRQVAVFG